MNSCTASVVLPVCQGCPPKLCVQELCRPGQKQQMVQVKGACEWKNIRSCIQFRMFFVHDLGVAPYQEIPWNCDIQQMGQPVFCVFFSLHLSPLAQLHLNGCDKNGPIWAPWGSWWRPRSWEAFGREWFFGHFSTALLKNQKTVLASDIPKRRTLSTKTRIASHSRILTSAGIWQGQALYMLYFLFTFPSKHSIHSI